jgi:ADP-heptose:LPS heptosyltransferase
VRGTKQQGRSCRFVVDFAVMAVNSKPATDPARILIVRVGALGDTLMATPLLRLLHKQRPQVEIDMLCSELAAPLLELSPHVSRLFRLKGRNLPLVLSLEKRRLVRELRNRKYEIALLLESAPRYRMLLEHARPRQISSFSTVPLDPGLHAIVNNLRVAGFQDPVPEDLIMDLPLADEDDTAAERILEGLPPPRIGMHIGWGPLGRKRSQSSRLRGWNQTNFSRLIDMFLRQNIGSIVLTGSPEDAPDTQMLRKQVPDERIRSIAGKTRVRELAAVIKRLDLLISVDSGPCHMAAALGTPLVVLWGPGRLEQTRPISAYSPVRIVRHPLPCAPCQSTPTQKKCRRNLCMESISPEEVFAEARSLLPLLLT